jgi:hypothetical protein
MSVVNYREVLPRTFRHRLGEAPVATRVVNITVTEPIAHQTAIDAVGIVHGSVHPEYGFLVCTDAAISEPDRHHVEITYTYEVPKGGDPQQSNPNPLARPDVWTFSSGTGSEVPALIYYDGNGNGTKKPLTNAAGDFFEGLTVPEAEVRLTIAGNRASFPASLAAAVTNAINDGPYLFGSKHCWQCLGIGASPASETVGNTQINYWQVTAELVYRASGYNLQLPHVGMHYVTSSGGAKFRTYVRADDGSDVPAATPQPLTSTGSQKYTGGTSGVPDILERRVYPEVNFSTYFGTPPF